MSLPGQPCATQHWALTLHPSPLQNPTPPLGPPHLLASSSRTQGTAAGAPTAGPPRSRCHVTHLRLHLGGVTRMLTAVPFGGPPCRQRVREGAELQATRRPPSARPCKAGRNAPQSTSQATAFLQNLCGSPQQLVLGSPPPGGTGGLVKDPAQPSPPGTGRHQSWTPHFRVPRPPCCLVRGGSEKAPPSNARPQWPPPAPAQPDEGGGTIKAGVLATDVWLHSPAVSPSPRMNLSRPHRGYPIAAGRAQPRGATRTRRGCQAGRDSGQRLGLL